MNATLLWIALISLCFLPFPDRATGAEKLATRLPEAGSSETLYFVWPNGQRVPALSRADGTVVLPDGSLPQGDVRLLLPDGQTLPVPSNGIRDLPPRPAAPDTAVTTPLPPPLSEAERLLLRQGTTLHEREDGTRVPVTVLPDGSVRRADGTLPEEHMHLLLPDGSHVTLPPHGKLDITQHGIVPTPPHQALARTPEPQTPTATPESRALPPSAAAGQTPDLLASLLPKTDIAVLMPATSATPHKTAPQTAVKTPAPSGTTTPPKPPSPEKKPESSTGAASPIKPAPTTAPRPEPRKNPAPATTPAIKPGEELHIPPEALRSGKLDFLEGCWQGTRPEYYSKRTIRECFCFDKGGRSGKRRIIDPSAQRRCIGSTQASLDGSGVLRVSSEGAYCDDGERWGSAEMTCRGNGRKTPCSWVFRDAQGGRQSYEIPFVRVTSCGR